MRSSHTFSPCGRTRNSGERGQLACSRRQPADDTVGEYARLNEVVTQERFPQAAENNRLAACAPQPRSGSSSYVSRDIPVEGLYNLLTLGG